jgi:hypothetical protein
MSDSLCVSDVTYCFTQDQLFWLTDGRVVGASQLSCGIDFYVEGGATASITSVGKPEVWETASSTPDVYGNHFRRILGKIKTTGLVPLLDVVYGNARNTMTPGHLFYSVNRSRGKHPVVCPISVKIGAVFFPHQAWDDYTLTILDWWLQKAIALLRGPSKKVSLEFMEGPYQISIEANQQGTWMLECTRTDSRQVIAKTECAPKQVVNEIRSALKTVLNGVEKAGLWNEGCVKLRSVLDNSLFSFQAN